MGGNDQICGRLSRCVALERFKAQHWSRIIRELMTPAMVLGESRFKHFTGAPRLPFHRYQNGYTNHMVRCKLFLPITKLRSFIG